MPEFPISPYPFTFLAAFLFSFLTAFFLLRREQVPGRIIGYTFALILVMSLYGAKVYGVITSGFQKNLLDTGIASLGGAIGLLAAVFIMGRIYREGRERLFRVFCMVLPLMYGISKIGCFLVGCCRGIPYSGPFAVSYHSGARQGMLLFPVQLTESLVFLGIFFAVLFYDLSVARRRKVDFIPEAVICLCAVSKFSLEYFRYEHIGKGITANQWVCGFFFLWGAVRIFILQKQKKLQQ